MTESRQKRKGLETMQVRLFTAQPAGGAAAWDELKKETGVCVPGGTRFSASEVFTFRCWRHYRYGNWALLRSGCSVPKTEPLVMEGTG